MSPHLSYLMVATLLLAMGLALWAIAALRHQVNLWDYVALATGSVIALMADSLHFSWSSWQPSPELTLGIGFLEGIPGLGLPIVEELVAVPALMALYSGVYVTLGRRDSQPWDLRWPQLMVVTGLMGLWFTLMWPGVGEWRFLALLFARLTILGLLLVVAPRPRWVLIAALISAPIVILWDTLVIGLGMFSYGPGTLAQQVGTLGVMTVEEYPAIWLDAMLGPAVIECARHLLARWRVHGATVPTPQPDREPA